MSTPLHDDYLANQPCSVGRELVWIGDSAPPGGYDQVWDRECPHPVQHPIKLVDRDSWLFLCRCHYKVLNELVGFCDTPQEAMAQFQGLPTFMQSGQQPE